MKPTASRDFSAPRIGAGFGDFPKYVYVDCRIGLLRRSYALFPPQRSARQQSGNSPFVSTLLLFTGIRFPSPFSSSAVGNVAENQDSDDPFE